MITNFSDTPFETFNQLELFDHEDYKIYPDKWPACEGHLIFVPKQNTTECIAVALAATVEYGSKLVSNGEIDGYQFGMNIGESAGQTVMWPHVHFMPRHTGDVEGFPGSIRLAHKGHRGAEYYLNHPEKGAEYLKRHEHLFKERGVTDE
mgnify:FL=1